MRGKRVRKLAADARADGSIVTVSQNRRIRRQYSRRGKVVVQRPKR